MEDSWIYVSIYFLWLPSAEFAVERVRLRVAEGGHYIPEETVRRRFRRGWDNFQRHYKELADEWIVFDNSAETPTILESLNE